MQARFFFIESLPCQTPDVWTDRDSDPSVAEMGSKLLVVRNNGVAPGDVSAEASMASVISEIQQFFSELK